MAPPRPTPTHFPYRRSSDLERRRVLQQLTADDRRAGTGEKAETGSDELEQPTPARARGCREHPDELHRKSTRLKSSHSQISYAVLCLTIKTHQRVVMTGIAT